MNDLEALRRLVGPLTKETAAAVAEAERAGDWERAVVLLGLNNVPSALFDWWIKGRVTVYGLRRLLPYAWCMPEFPEPASGRVNGSRYFAPLAS